MKYWEILAVIAVFTWNVHCTCLSSLDGKKCSEIQLSAQRFAITLRHEDKNIQELLFRTIEEAINIFISSMDYLKENSKTVTVTFKGSTPIETPEFTKIKSEVQTTVAKAVRIGNTKFWKLVKKGSQLLLADKIVSTALMKDVADSTSGTNTITKFNLTATVITLTPDLVTIVTDVAKELEQCSNKLFDLYTRSIKLLLDGKVNLNFDEVKKNLEVYLVDTTKTLVASHIKASLISLHDALKEIEIIDSLAENVKTKPTDLTSDLKQAEVLVSEARRIIQNISDQEELEKKLRDASDRMKDRILKIKNTSTF